MSDFYIFLEEKGFDKNKIESFSDEDLSKLYNEYIETLKKEKMNKK